ncbi:MAG TPA: prolyl aminopeptidase [Hyphomicrobiaceae bacterium]|nr:prolyl aminopeptidase [Hyphomicrobiaceae bacterium]
MSARDRLSFYGPIQPFRRGHLAVSDGHEIYFEQSGNVLGEPVLVVHGGPGGGSNPTMRRFHDPARYHIILFDQRGAGRSTPHASLESNTTWDLVADMERLRTSLGIERWHLFGGSWGATLSLIYAEMHPDRVSSLVLRGTFLMRPEEVRWFYQDGARWIFPDAYAAYEAVIPPEERGDMVGAYYRRLTHPDRQVQLEAARAWSIYEGSTLSLHQDPERLRLFSADAYALAFARIECHYFRNNGFLEHPDQILRQADRLRSIPGVIVHGRYDVVTPLKTSFDLKARWPEADLRIVPDAGHAMTEPGIVHELISATRRMAGRGD